HDMRATPTFRRMPRVTSPLRPARAIRNQSKTPMKRRAIPMARTPQSHWSGTRRLNRCLARDRLLPNVPKMPRSPQRVANRPLTSGRMIMNVASLQIEGLLMAVAAINNMLTRKGVLSVEEVDLALRKVEASLTGDDRLYEDMSPANRDAVCFPIRLLITANNAQGEASVPSFTELTRMVGLNKRPYNDQM